MFEFLDSVGMLGNASSTPDWVILYFEATVSDLDSFVPSLYAIGSATNHRHLGAPRRTRETGGRRPANNFDINDEAVAEWLQRIDLILDLTAGMS